MKPNFFAQRPESADRNLQQAERPRRRIRPKIPDGPQRSGQQAEKQGSSTRQAQQDVQPGNSLHPAEKKHKHRQQGGQAVAAVQDARQARMPQPQGPEQIVEQRDAAPQHNGLDKCQQLNRNFVLHIS